MVRPLELESSKIVGCHFDKTLAYNLDFWRNSVLEDDWDCVGIIDGREGSGKSTLAGQVAKYLDKDHEIDLSAQVAFTPDEFVSKALKLPKGKAIIYDESRTGLNRRQSMTANNIRLTNFLAECRQLNLFVILVMPYFQDMDAYLIKGRATFLIHTEFFADHELKKFKKGYWSFFGIEQIKSMFFDEKFRRMMRYGKSDLRGTFFDFCVYDKEAYKKMKAEALEKYNKSLVPKEPTAADNKKLENQILARTVYLLKEKKLLPYGAIDDIAKTFNISTNELYALRREFAAGSGKEPVLGSENP